VAAEMTRFVPPIAPKARTAAAGAAYVPAR
jgi:hypothetical protein